jgi:cell division septum initiation protein DivIVA
MPNLTSGQIHAAKRKAAIRLKSIEWDIYQLHQERKELEDQLKSLEQQEIKLHIAEHGVQVLLSKTRQPCEPKERKPRKDAAKLLEEMPKEALKALLKQHGLI